MNAHIVFVDDNLVHLRRFLKEIALAAVNVDVTLIDSASSLVTALDGLESAPPHLFVLDMVIIERRGADSTDELPDYTPYEGGIWLAQKIRSRPSLQKVPILFFSTVEAQDTQRLVARHLRSSERQQTYYASNLEEPEAVARKVLALASANVELVPLEKGITRAMLESVELKPGFFGIKIDLKKLFRVEQ